MSKMKRDPSVISKPSNGVAFSSQLQSAFYTYTRLGIPAYFFKREGHIGMTTMNADMKVKIIDKMRSPNGIDLDQTEPETVLVVAATLDNAVKRIRVSGGKSEEN